MLASSSYSARHHILLHLSPEPNSSSSSSARHRILVHLFPVQVLGIDNIVIQKCYSQKDTQGEGTPASQEKIEFLERHKDYVHRAQAFLTKEETLRVRLYLVPACSTISKFSFILKLLLEIKVREKASFRNPDEFFFKMIKTKVVNGVHRAESEANKFIHGGGTSAYENTRHWICPSTVSKRKEVV